MIVLSPHTSASPFAKLRPDTAGSRSTTLPSSQAKAAVKVMIQIVLPIGAPRIRCEIGRSLSCQVHHRNLAPTMS